MLSIYFKNFKCSRWKNGNKINIFKVSREEKNVWINLNKGKKGGKKNIVKVK